LECYATKLRRKRIFHSWAEKKHSHIHCGSISLIINTRPGTNWAEYYWNVTKFWNYIRRNGSTARLKRFWPRQMKRPEEILCRVYCTPKVPTCIPSVPKDIVKSQNMSLCFVLEVDSLRLLKKINWLWQDRENWIYKTKKY